MNMEYHDDLRRAREAAGWLLRLESDGRACYTAFFQWMMSSPQHVREFLAVSKMSRRLDQMDPQREIAVGPLARQVSADVVPFPPTGETEARTSGPVSRRKQLWAAGIAAAVVASTAAGFWMMTRLGSAHTYATGLGEQRSFKLDDGSVVHLNAQSRVEVHYTQTAREMRLSRGEALFIVAQDTKKPFRVSAGTALIQALGTEFNVNRRGEGTIVSVVEGRVGISVNDAAGAAPFTILGAGQQASVAASGAVQKRNVPDVQQPLAWRQRRLVFQDIPLAEAAAEFNRYNDPQFEVEGADVRGKRISGVFSADHPEALVLYLQRDESLVVERKPEAVVVRRRLSTGEAQ